VAWRRGRVTTAADQAPLRLMTQFGMVEYVSRSVEQRPSMVERIAAADATSKREFAGRLLP
jgi:hypothetical protein